MKVRFSALASVDLGAAVSFLVERNPAAAARLSTRVLETVERLAAGEFDGPSQRLSTGETVRSWPVPPLPVYYQRRGDELLLERVYRQARRPLVPARRRRRRRG